MKGLYPETVDFEKKLYTTLRAYNTFDKTKMPEMVESSLKHFRTNNADKKLKIITDLLDIVNADGKVEATERAALTALNKTINSYL